MAEYHFAKTNESLNNQEVVNQRFWSGGPKEDNKLIYPIQQSIATARQIDLVVSFLMESGVRLILEDLKDAVKRHVPIRILCGAYMSITEPSALVLLKNELGFNADIRMDVNQCRSFHPKCYIFHDENGCHAYIGSSNLSASALTSGVEWNYRVDSQTDSMNLNQICEEFEELFEQSRILDEELLNTYCQSWKKPPIVRQIKFDDRLNDQELVNHSLDTVKPHGVQIEALYALKKTRENGNKKAMIQAATGVGKTYLAAFDSLEFQKVLFVAHRKEILEQAARSFHHVRPDQSLGFIDGDHKDMDQLIGYIDSTIDEADSFLSSLDIDLDKIIEDSNTLDKLDALRNAYDTIVAKDDDKEKFKVILNTLTNLYEASKPEIFEKNWDNDKFAPLVYLHGLFYHTIDDEKVARARQKMNQILDGSVTANQDFVNYVREEPAQYMIKGTKAIDLSKIDIEQLRKEIKTAEYKAIEINDLKIYIDQALEQMIKKNCTRLKFSERFKRIIDSYNAGGTENEEFYEQLVKLLEEMREEDKRANTEGLTEEELEIYDLLIAGKKLTQAEEQKVKLSAKNLYKKLVDNRSRLLVVDWYKDEQPCAKLKYEVELSLNDNLPESYDKEAFDSKVSLLMNHFVDMAVQGYGWIGAA